MNFDLWLHFDFWIQAVASIVLFVGIYDTGNIRLRGPAAAVLAELLFILIGIAHSVWSLSLVGIVLGVLQARTLVLWHKKGVRW